VIATTFVILDSEWELRGVFGIVGLHNAMAGVERVWRALATVLELRGWYVCTS
jgi:hypothetical protein